jgi:hypothetical protein
LQCNDFAVAGIDALSAGRAALARGEWSAAGSAFRSVLRHGPDPAADLGLSAALRWLGDMGGSDRHRERAFAGYFQRDDRCNAGAVALSLAIYRDTVRGDVPGARAWAARATRLIGGTRGADDPNGQELRGWLILTRSVLAGDPGVAEELAREALAVARRLTDRSLQLWALAQLGLSLVRQARCAQGFGYLDEAQAGVLARESQDRDAVVMVTGQMLAACAEAQDPHRAMLWIRTAEAFRQRNGGPWLDARCTVTLGAVLLAGGRLEDAGRRLPAAVRAAAGRFPALHRLATGLLADLRVREGRPAEAGELLDGTADDDPAGVAAALAIARLRIARREWDAAHSGLVRLLREVGWTRLAALDPLELLVEAALARHDPVAAAAAADALSSIAARTGRAVDRARAGLAAGRMLAARGELGAAAGALRSGVDELSTHDRPYEAAQAMLVLARVQSFISPARAIATAHRAAAVADALGTQLLAAQAGELIGVLSATGRPRVLPPAGTPPAREPLWETALRTPPR